jgi:hypothetical protein
MAVVARGSTFHFRAGEAVPDIVGQLDASISLARAQAS